jgi:predicted DNA-binding WGR domain protein
MESGKIGYNGIIYMIHSTKHKFWEVRNQGSLNRFRFGKLRNACEVDISSGNSQYSNPTLAIERAEILILDKKERGYTIQNFSRPSIVSEPSPIPKAKKSSPVSNYIPFKPASVSSPKPLSFLASSESVPVSTSPHSPKPQTSLSSGSIPTYSFAPSISVPPAKEKVLKEISLDKSDKKTPLKNRFTNLLPNSSAFQGAFLEKDTANGMQYFKIQLNGVHIRCASWKDGVAPKKLEKKYESSIKAEDAAKKYIADLHKKGFVENAQKFKFDFFYTGCSVEEPEFEVDIMDSPETACSPSDSCEKYEKKRYRTVEDMLRSIGLERFLSIFDSENVGRLDFLKLNENDLEKLNLPPSARRKIVSSIIDGRWCPGSELGAALTKKQKMAESM